MWRLTAIARLVRQISQHGIIRTQTLRYCYSPMLQHQTLNQSNASRMTLKEDQFNHRTVSEYSGKDAEGICKQHIGENVSRKDKINVLVSTLLDLKDSKEAVYRTLDTCVAWEQNFPIWLLKRALLTLEKEQQWHRIIQVIKWMLSKGQGTTLGTYGQLIRALDKDHRAEEAHKFWVKKVGIDLHSVPWQLCNIMISVYYRNNMLEDLVKLFKGLEAFDRKPREKSIVQKVADAHEMLGLHEEKERILETYKHLFTETGKGSLKKSRKNHSKEMEKLRQRKYASNSDSPPNAVDVT